MIRKIPLICNEIALFMEERADTRVEWSLSKSFRPLVHQTRPFRFVHDTLVFGPSCTKPALSVHDTLVFVPSCTKPALSVHDHSYSVEESG